MFRNTKYCKADTKKKGLANNILKGSLKGTSNLSGIQF